MSVPSDRTNVQLNALLIGAALMAMASAGAGPTWQPVHFVAKPLATITTMLIAISARHPVSSSYRMRLVAGLLASLVGDIFLMLPGDYFALGLAAFLFAHLCYFSAFWLETGRVVRVDVLAGYLSVATALLVAIYPLLPSGLRIPVVLYVVVITMMATQSGTWMLTSPSIASKRAAIGAAWFLVSDATLAIDRFRTSVPRREVVVLGTYFVAQWLLAKSVDLSTPVET